MRLTSYDGITFTSLGLTAPGFDNPASPGPNRSVATIPRTGAHPYVAGVEQGTQTLTATFTPATGQNTETTLFKLMALLNPDDPTDRVLTATLEDATVVETEAHIGGWSYRSTNTIAVDFVISSPGFRATADTTLKTAGLISANGSFTNLNTGFRDIYPDVTVYWDGAQRASSTATFGWKHRIGTGLSITNNGTSTIRNMPYQIGPINTRALVTASQLQADGDDLRVFCQGKELNRNLIGINTRYTFVWVIPPDIAPEETITLDLIINNSTATSPPTLTATSSPRLPAMDISGFKFVPSAAGASSVSTSGLELDQWKGGLLIVDNAAGTGAAGQIRRISASTSTLVNVERPFTTTPALTDDIILVKSGLAGTGGATSSSTANTLVDSSANWSTIEQSLVGGTLHIVSGTGSGQTRAITDVNSGTDTLTVSPNWTTNPGVGSIYRIYKPNGLHIWDNRNGSASYDHDTGHRGMWFANKTQAPPTIVDFDAPGSWYRFVYQRNKDTFSQPRFMSRLVGAGDYDHYPLVQIQRARKDKTAGQREIGVADAVGYYSPFPITGFYLVFNMRNAKLAGSGTPGEGMCEARVMVQEAGGEIWSTVWSDNAVYTSPTLVSALDDDILTYTDAHRLAITLVPNGSDDIPSSDNDTALLETTDDSAGFPVLVFVTPGSVITESVDWWTATPAAVAVYDVHLLIRNGGASAVKPYDQIQIGGIDRRIFIAATDERIVVDCERHLVTLTTDAGVFIRSIPYSAIAQQIVSDAFGVEQTMVNARWLPVAANTVDAANIYYTDPSGAGWGSVGLLVTGRRGYVT